jgi:hypothetical protein
MRVHTNIRAVASALIAVTAMAVSAPVLAATTTTTTGAGNGMQVSPLRTELTITPGASTTTSVFVQNVTGQNETLQTLVNDFTAGGSENGTPQLLLNGENDKAHGLRQFVNALPNVTLKPNEQREVKVTITIPSGTAAGGYYGAVRFAPAGVLGGQNVNLAASVGSLILVRVPGNIKEDVKIASLDVRRGNSPRIIFTNGKSLSAMVRFENKGNVQEAPFGKIQLRKGTKTIDTKEINTGDQRGNVLPDSFRQFTVPLDNIGAFGKYTVQGNFGYGTNGGQLLTAQTTFYVIPVAAIAAGVIVVILLLAAIFILPRMIRSYNKKIVRQASRRR